MAPKEVTVYFAGPPHTPTQNNVRVKFTENDYVRSIIIGACNNQLLPSTNVDTIEISYAIDRDYRALAKFKNIRAKVLGWK